SDEYARACTGYAVAALARRIKYSTRGSTLQIKPSGAVMVNHIFVNEGSLTFSYDYFEAGIGTGPGTWDSMVASSVSTLKGILEDIRGTPTRVSRGSATALARRSATVTAVVTDPPYDQMIAYADASDLFFAW